MFIIRYPNTTHLHSRFWSKMGFNFYLLIFATARSGATKYESFQHHGKHAPTHVFFFQYKES